MASIIYERGEKIRIPYKNGSGVLEGEITMLRRQDEDDPESGMCIGEKFYPNSAFDGAEVTHIKRNRSLHLVFHVTEDAKFNQNYQSESGRKDDFPTDNPALLSLEGGLPGR